VGRGVFLGARAANAQIPRDPTPVVAKTTPTDIAAGKTLYEATRSKCHGLDGGGSDKGNFFALDAETGKPLWEIYLGSSLRSNPLTYSVSGKQYVFVTAGTTYFVFALP
jgi:outer membrane protein assembly factor BamB